MSTESIREKLIRLVQAQDKRPRAAAEHLVDRWLNGAASVHASWPFIVHQLVAEAHS